MDGTSQIWGQENERIQNGITAPRRMVLLEWPRMGFRSPSESCPLFPLRELEIWKA